MNAVKLFLSFFDSLPVTICHKGATFPFKLFQKYSNPSHFFIRYNSYYKLKFF
jgi:hypothetical protein